MYRNGLILVLCLGVFGYVGWAQNAGETPANVPRQGTAVQEQAQPERRQPVRQPPVQRTAPSRSIPNDLLPKIEIKPMEEKPLYQNVALYVGGGCFLVVFIGLYMIMMSGPAPRSKRKKKRG